MVPPLKKAIPLWLCFFVFSSVTFAQQDTLQSVKKTKPIKSFFNQDRKWSIEVPVWVPGFVGEFAYGDVSVEGEDGSNPGTPEHPIEPPEPGEPPIGGGNIISRLFTSTAYLKFFFMNRVTFKSGPSLAQFDAFAGAVGNQVKFKMNDNTVANAEARTVLFRIFYGYRFFHRESKSKKTRYQVYAYAGGRFHFFNIQTQSKRLNLGFTIDPFWAEPILGLQARFVKKNWLLQLQGDVGSFNINDELSTMLNGNLFYRASNLIAIKIGWTDWRIRHQDYIRGEKLYLKTHLSGPSTGVVFYF